MYINTANYYKHAHLVDKRITIPLPHSGQHLRRHDNDTQWKLCQEQKLTTTLKEQRKENINKCHLHRLAARSQLLESVAALVLWCCVCELQSTNLKRKTHFKNPQPSGAHKPLCLPYSLRYLNCMLIHEKCSKISKNKKQ